MTTATEHSLYNSRPHFLLCFALLVIVTGCNVIDPGYHYYYQPTIADRALKNTVSLYGKNQDNQVNPNNSAKTLHVTDTDVFTFLQDVKQAWRQRSQIARVGGAIGGVSAVGLAAGATTAVATHGGSTAGNTVPILTGIGTFIGQALGLLNPSGRDEAYKDGINLLLAAEAEYCHNLIEDQENCEVNGMKMTQAGAILLERTNAAIVVVDKALIGTIPTKEQVEAATAKIATVSNTSIKVSPSEISLPSKGSTEITVIRGRHVVATSRNDQIAKVDKVDKSDPPKFKVTAGNDCQTTMLDFSNGVVGQDSVRVRVESAPSFEPKASKLSLSERQFATFADVVQTECAIKVVTVEKPEVAEVTLTGDKTITIKGKQPGNTTIRLINKTERTGEITLEVKASPRVVAFAMQKSPVATIVAEVVNFQEWLNSFPNISIEKDGVPGRATSDAYFKVTKEYLPGDPLRK